MARNSKIPGHRLQFKSGELGDKTTRFFVYDNSVGCERISSQIERLYNIAFGR